MSFQIHLQFYGGCVGFLLVPRRILSMVDCFNPASVASLFIAVLRILYYEKR